MSYTQKSRLKNFYESDFFKNISYGNEKLLKIKEQFINDEKNHDENNVIYHIHNKYQKYLDVPFNADSPQTIRPKSQKTIRSPKLSQPIEQSHQPSNHKLSSTIHDKNFKPIHEPNHKLSSTNRDKNFKSIHEPNHKLSSPNRDKNFKSIHEPNPIKILGDNGNPLPKYKQNLR